MNASDIEKITAALRKASPNSLLTRINMTPDEIKRAMQEIAAGAANDPPMSWLPAEPPTPADPTAPKMSLADAIRALPRPPRITPPSLSD